MTRQPAAFGRRQGGPREEGQKQGGDRLVGARWGKELKMRGEEGTVTLENKEGDERQQGLMEENTSRKAWQY